MTRTVIAKGLIITACLSHIIYLVLGVFYDYLGANPIETLTHTTGEWALYCLLATLTITPLRRLFRWNVLARFRRMIGLLSFFYVSLHLTIFIIFDHVFDWRSIVEDIIDRPYITVGVASFAILLPLAVTSFSALQRKMGKHWVRLHRWVYVAAVLGIVHYWWLVKVDVFWPFVYGMILALLLACRVYFFSRKHASSLSTHR